ncbi:MAG: acetolactate synthase, partial [Planctomycetota bacterium]
MSLGEDSGSTVEFDTMRGRDYPTIRQFTVFMENRVGQLQSIFRRFKDSGVRIVALNIQDSTECSIVRFVFSHPERGREILERVGLAMIESDLVAVIMEDEAQPLLTICSALLRAEINLVQSYPLLVRSQSQMVIALKVSGLSQ